MPEAVKFEVSDHDRWIKAHLEPSLMANFKFPSNKSIVLRNYCDFETMWILKE